METVTDFILGGSKITAYGDFQLACWKKSYDQLKQHIKKQRYYFANIRVFSNESGLCIRWPKYWSFSFNIRPSNEYLGLISFRMD